MVTCDVNGGFARPALYADVTTRLNGVPRTSPQVDIEFPGPISKSTHRGCASPAPK